ncbi:hypothetical protein GCM10025868_03750 [Angustibacter aerolatus]|uniref:SHS2 domain-containing protein n=1 Tax=Angustibacter aerolatus TaxID=1162965 RepID=A0ABQ6JAA9_9ACTN|nr:pilus assembly protein PilM [Angustibacter aerolatus]GMA85125.1 hypothetical protein GCM10025868_03750 [Angustibacter aerolatus]
MAGRTTIGLDVGTSGVRAAELSFGKRGVTLEKFGQVALPEGVVRDGEVADPAQAHARREAAVGGHRLLAQEGRPRHRQPARRRAPGRACPGCRPRSLREALPYQVQDFLPMPVDQAVLDFHPVEDLTSPGQPRMVRGMLVAAVRSVVLTNVNAVQRAGLSVTGVDLTSFAVLRSMAEQGAADSDVVALVDIGAKVTNIVVHRAGVPLLVRILLLGGQDVTDAVADAVGLPSAQAEALKQMPQATGRPHDELVTAGRAIDDSAAVFVDEVRRLARLLQARRTAAPAACSGSSSPAAARA